MYYMLLYEVVEDFIERRTPFREAHLSLARAAHDRGELLLAGALVDPADAAALVFHTEDPSIPTAFARADPYVVEGLVTRWRVRKWNVVIGGEAKG